MLKKSHTFTHTYAAALVYMTEFLELTKVS